MDLSLGNRYREDLHRRMGLDALSCQRSVQASDVKMMARGDERAFLGFCERNEIGPMVAYELLKIEDVSLSLRDEWQSVFDRSAERMKIMMTVLDEVGEILAQKGIAVIALKNAGIARGIFPIPACCPMGDLDVLIDRQDFRKAHRALLGAGFDLATRAEEVEPADLEHGFLSGGTEYLKNVEGLDIWVELQWRPVAGRWIRVDQEPNGAELVDRSIEIAGSKVRLLSPNDNLLQVSLHTAKHTYVRAPGLRLHTDVDRLVKYTKIDWPEFVQTVRQTQVTVPVYFSLALAKSLLETPIPSDVLGALAPPEWKERLIMTWLERCDIFEPHEKKFNRVGMLAFHALLYDEAKGLVASVFDTEREQLGLRHLPANVAKGTRRMVDLLTRYQA